MSESEHLPAPAPKRKTVMEQIREQRGQVGDITIADSALPFPAEEIGLSGMEDPVERALKVALYCMKQSGYCTLKPLLPAC